MKIRYPKMVPIRAFTWQTGSGSLGIVDPTER
jgi:hypothetical protein